MPHLLGRAGIARVAMAAPTVAPRHRLRLESRAASITGGGPRGDVAPRAPGRRLDGERAGSVRWLRPEYQRPRFAQDATADAAGASTASTAAVEFPPEPCRRHRPDHSPARPRVRRADHRGRGDPPLHQCAAGDRGPPSRDPSSHPRRSARRIRLRDRSSAFLGPVRQRPYILNLLKRKIRCVE